MTSGRSSLVVAGEAIDPGGADVEMTADAAQLRAVVGGTGDFMGARGQVEDDAQRRRRQLPARVHAARGSEPCPPERVAGVARPNTPGLGGLIPAVEVPTSGQTDEAERIRELRTRISRSARDDPGHGCRGRDRGDTHCGWPRQPNALDRDVWAAYGWDDITPEAMSDEEILSRLLALNRERAAVAGDVGSVVGSGISLPADDQTRTPLRAITQRCSSNQSAIHASWTSAMTASEVAKASASRRRDEVGRRTTAARGSSCRANLDATSQILKVACATIADRAPPACVGISPGRGACALRCIVTAGKRVEADRPR